MKPFNLEQALQGHPVITRSGDTVDIVKTGLTGLRNGDSIIAVVTYYDDSQLVNTYQEDGTFNVEDEDPSGLDLFLVDVTEEGSWNAPNELVG